MSTAESQATRVVVNGGGGAVIELHRPEVRNAYNTQMGRELYEACVRCNADDSIRAVVLTGSGDVFSAGGDLKGMTRQANNSGQGRLDDATEFATVLGELDRLSKPLIGRINGSAFGGGLGLISVCDIALGLTGSTFRLSEVTLGLIPATISPDVVAKIGVPHARRIMLNAAPLDGASPGDPFAWLLEAAAPRPLTWLARHRPESEA